MARFTIALWISLLLGCCSLGFTGCGMLPRDPYKARFDDYRAAAFDCLTASDPSCALELVHKALKDPLLRNHHRAWLYTIAFEASGGSRHDLLLKALKLSTTDHGRMRALNYLFYTGADPAMKLQILSAAEGTVFFTRMLEALLKPLTAMEKQAFLRKLLPALQHPQAKLTVLSHLALGLEMTDPVAAVTLAEELAQFLFPNAGDMSMLRLRLLVRSGDDIAVEAMLMELAASPGALKSGCTVLEKDGGMPAQLMACLKTFISRHPKSLWHDNAWYHLVRAAVDQNKIADAKSVYERFKHDKPGSPLVGEAAAYLKAHGVDPGL